ncbi:MAG: hypothetical protein IT460_17555 [Planctomycetes bacterium]|nr:hypothetical protein [Planctomycetota bacterium]
MEGWLFDTHSGWTATVPSAPKFETYRQYFEVAVPEIARLRRGAARTPCVVVARVTARPVAGRSQPGGPKDRAKGLMDALHDDRRNGPKYRDLGAVPPLPDDHGEYVHGLAVEVQAGASDSVEYRLGPSLQVAGKHLFVLDVSVPAPNDIAESAALVAPRRAFVEDLVRRCDRRAAAACASKARAVVVRHRPQRDEDNTWATWISALTGGSVWSREAWGPEGSPLAGWSPMAIASVADPTLPCEVRYEVYG